jgi:hypothetical protein
MIPTLPSGYTVDKKPAKQKLQTMINHLMDFRDKYPDATESELAAFSAGFLAGKSRNRTDRCNGSE